MPIHGYPGNVITSNAVVPNSGSASGVWTTEQQLQAQNAGNWPQANQILRSLRFNSADSAYLNRTPASAGNRRTFTVSLWVKRAALGTLQYLWEGGSPDGQTTRLLLRFQTDDTLRLATGGTTIFNTTQVFRDPSAWYHIVVAIDTPNATQASRSRLYVNGTEVTAWSTSPSFGQNDDTGWNMAQAHSIGRSHIDSAGYLSGYLTEMYNIDGQALTPSSFGQTNGNTGVWEPKRYSGSYGTNGFYLTFQDNSGTTSTTLGKDYSGNGNNWTPNNFSVSAGAGNDSLVDTPTPYGVDTGVGGTVRGNYATWNPLDKDANITFSNGNLDAVGYNAGGTATFGLTSGKWYWEVTINDPYSVSGSSYYGIFGVSSGKPNSYVSGYVGYPTGAGVYATDFSSDGGTWASGSRVTSSTTWANGDVIGLAFDAGAMTLDVYRNNSKIGSTLTVPSGAIYPTLYHSGTSGDTSSSTSNFGQRPFAYTAPSGFKALCTQNLPTPTIGATSTTQADDYFNAVLYTGDRTDRTITVGFQPDWVWVKSRNQADNHYLMNAVVGTGKYLCSNLTDAEATNANTLTAFTSTGFSIGNTGTTNETGRTYVAWNWRANGSGTSNTAGSITSTVSANTTSGFSIVTYTGTGSGTATIGHGLGVAPSMIIVKFRNTTSNWSIYHASVGNTKRLVFTTAAEETGSGYWNNTTPTSTVFTLGTDLNQSYDFVAYCFAPIAGYSAFGSYTGNGSTDGPFIFTGFKPAYVVMKCSSTTGGWVIRDYKRGPYNVQTGELAAQSSDAEATPGQALDFLSNGFKLRNTDAWYNANGATYIFMAFAENPFKYTLAR
jgi:hypothetical protein